MKEEIFVNYHLDNNFISNPICYGKVRLYQIGRLHAKGTVASDSHVQKAFELTIVRDGAGVIITNNQPTKVSRGDIYLSYPCEIHKIESDIERPLKYDFFAFDADDEKIKNQLERIMLEYGTPDKRVFSDERINYLVGNAISEIQSNSLFSEELLENLFLQILIYVVRSFRSCDTYNFSDRVTDAETLCYRLMNYIDTHIYSMKKLEELSEVTGYSYGYLSALYKKTISNTLADYYRNKRLEVARLLVLEKKLKIIEIAELLNYASVYAFSKAFKNRFGSSPENYCKMQNKHE